MNTHTPIPKDHPVQPLKPGQPAKHRATCVHCGLSWDDGKVTSMTPAPAARCPFEPFHLYPRADEFTPKPTPPYAFLVVVLGYWGRGHTVQEAAQGCRKQGARPTDATCVYLIIGDDKPVIDDRGSTHRATGSHNFRIAKGLKLGQLLKLQEFQF